MTILRKWLHGRRFCNKWWVSLHYIGIYGSSNLPLDLKMWEKFESKVPVCLPSAVALLSMICLIWKIESSGWTETSRIIPVCKKHWTSTKSTMKSSLKDIIVWKLIKLKRWKTEIFYFYNTIHVYTPCLTASIRTILLQQGFEFNLEVMNIWIRSFSIQPRIVRRMC